MTQRGRKSATGNVVALRPTGSGPRLTPPSLLSNQEAQLFSELAAAAPHLSSTDTPILTSYVLAISKSNELSRSHDTASWEKTVRVMMALARTLRLTAQSLVDPKTAFRKRPPPPSFYDVMPLDDDDADE